jgi:serine/threonine protein kinase
MGPQLRRAWPLLADSDFPSRRVWRVGARRILGTPNNHLWPGVESLPDYQNTFPQWRPSDMHAKMSQYLEPAGIDLLMVRIRTPRSHQRQSCPLAAPRPLGHAAAQVCMGVAVDSPFGGWWRVDDVQKMLAYDPSSRISAQDALQHEYFAVRRTHRPCVPWGSLSQTRTLSGGSDAIGSLTAGRMWWACAGSVHSGTGYRASSSDAAGIALDHNVSTRGSSRHHDGAGSRGRGRGRGGLWGLGFAWGGGGCMGRVRSMK